MELVYIDNESHFELKKRIEFDQPNQNFLFYINKAIDTAERDWLYDVRFYSEMFLADSSSLILNELDMRMEFRGLISQYKPFFKNSQRLTKLKKIIPAKANKEEFELALIAVLFKTETENFSQILLKLLEELII